MYINITDQSQT